MTIGSYSFYSKDININKYNAFKAKAEQIRDYKNCLSQEISGNLFKYLEMSKFDMVKMFGNSSTPLLTSKDLIYSVELQKVVEDVLTCYSNKFDAIKNKMSFKLQKDFKVFYYKRKSGRNKKGDIRDFVLTKRSTPLSKVMSYLAKYGFEGSVEYLSKKLEDVDIKDSQLKFYLEVLRCLEKFGEERLLNLAFSKRENILKRYNRPIVFNSLSYRSAIRTKAPLLQEHKGFTNAMVVINSMYSRDALKANAEFKTKNKMIVPVNFHSKHHGSLDDFTSKEYTVCVEDKRIRFIATKEVERNYAIDKESFYGVDVNLKHNLFSTSTNKTVDFDRKLLKKYCNFLRIIDAKKPEERTKGEVRLFKLWQRRIEVMIKAKCAKLVNDAISQDKDHIVMEDLGLFVKNFGSSNEFEGIKISRLGRLLGISNLKNIISSICEKKGVQLTIIPSYYTSQLCSSCGHISRENRKSQEKFICENCGDSRNADFNASINIALIGEHEVHDHYLLKRSSNGWYEPTFKSKVSIRNRLENIVLKEAFQRSRLQLVTA